jgi:hypothetical protein
MSSYSSKSDDFWHGFVDTCVEVMTPNNRIERGGMDKVLRRGRVGSVVEQVLRARVRDASACARSCERWAPSQLSR